MGDGEYVAARMRLIVFVMIMVAMAGGVTHVIFWPSPPPPQSWADGTYDNPCCAPLILHGGIITAEGRTTRYRVERGKRGYLIDVPAGIGVRQGRVVFEGTFVFNQFNRNSELEPAVHEAKALHISGLGDDLDYVFAKR